MIIDIYNTIKNEAELDLDAINKIRKREKCKESIVNL